MAAYPNTLPAPLLTGYALSPLKKTIRTPMEVGFARVRRISKAKQDMVSVNFLFNKVQMQTFRAWFENDAEVADGVSFFDLRLDTGNGVAVVKQCRFVDEYDAARDGLFWRVSAKLEVR